jgi:hypothetical protein
VRRRGQWEVGSPNPLRAAAADAAGWGEIQSLQARRSGDRWKAQISYGGKQHNLGRFDTKQQAALAYDREARQCGKDKALNYESIAAEEAAAVTAAQVLEEAA